MLSASVILALLLVLAVLAAQSALAAASLGRAARALEGRDAATAAAHLATAQGWGAAGPNYQRYAARLALLEGRPDDAVTALESAYRLQPNSLLIADELVTAYLAAGRLDDAAPLLRRAGLDPDTAEKRANTALAAGDGAEASRWLERAAALEPARTPDLLFRRAAAALLAGAPNAPDLLEALAAAQPDFRIYPADGVTRIPGAELRWLLDHRAYGVFFGDRLDFGASDGRGSLWWSGRAMATVDVPEAGRYLLRVRALEDRPAPIAIAVEIAGEPVLRTNLTRENGEWAILEQEVVLKPGPQALVVRFLNDGSVDGVDRNATVAWVELERLEP